MELPCLRCENVLTDIDQTSVVNITCAECDTEYHVLYDQGEDEYYLETVND